MELGVEQVVSEGTKGSQWQTYITYKKNGELLSDTKFHSSTYKGHAPEVKKNMQGVVVPTEHETLAGGEIIDETVIAGPGGPGDQTETQAGPSSEGPSSQAGPSETKSKQDNEGPSQGGPSQSEAAPETAAPQTEAPSRPSERESDVNNAPGGNGDAPSVPDAPGGGEIETIAPHPGE